MSTIIEADYIEVKDTYTDSAIRVRTARPGENLRGPRMNNTPSIAETFPLSPVRNPYFQRDLTTINFAHEAYKINSLVYAVISKRANATAQGKWCVYDVAKPDEPITDPELVPLLKLLNNPSPLWNKSEFLRASEIYKCIGGTAYVHKVRDGAGSVIQLNLYHATQIYPVQGDIEWCVGYRYSNGAGFECFIPKSDIIPLKWTSVDVVRPYKVVPPLVALAAEIDVDNERARMALSLLINGAIPSFSITAPDGVMLTQQMIDTQAERLMEKLGGRQRGRHMILPHGSTIEKLGFSPNDMATDVFEKIPVTRACEIFGVPIQLTSFQPGLQASQFKNYQEAQEFFYEHTISSNWESIATAMTDHMKDEVFYGDSRKYEVCFDVGHIGPLQESIDAVQERAAQAFAGNYMKLNEARAEAGLEADPKYGEQYLWELQAGAKAAGLDTQAADAANVESLKKAARADRRSRGVKVIRGC